MDQILKAARLEKSELNDAELALINKQTLREMTADEIFVFRLAACNNKIDRDFERFTDSTLEDLAVMYVGRTVLMDHNWSAAVQTARVYAASVEPMGGEDKQLVFRCYMPRTEDTQKTITAIESGILRECSVGCAVKHVICSICGVDQTKAWCEHAPGQEYDGVVCHMELDGAADAYEVSLVPVPAQPGAGIVKSKRYGGVDKSEDALPADHPKPDGSDDWAESAALELEKEKFFMEV